MIDKKNLANLKVIADEYGYENQSMQLIEEMAELTQAINKYRRYGTYEKKCQIIEEIADTSIMLEQVSYLLHIDQAKLVFDTYVEDKIDRTMKRLKNQDESHKDVKKKDWRKSMIEKFNKKSHNKTLIICGLATSLLMLGGMFTRHEEIWISLIGYVLALIGAVCVGYLGSKITELRKSIDWLLKNR